MNNHSAIKSALAIVTSQGSVYAANITATDLARLRGETVWLTGDRLRMMKAMDTIFQGGLEIAGIPPIQMPAEVLAAGIACVVHPTNWLTAAVWSGERFSLMAEARGIEAGRDKAGQTVITPRQMYALIVQAYDDPAPFRTNLEKKLNKLVDPAAEAQLNES